MTRLLGFIGNTQPVLDGDVVIGAVGVVTVALRPCMTQVRSVPAVCRPTVPLAGESLAAV